MATPLWSATASGSFTATANWTPATAPAAGDSVYFQNNAYSVTSGFTDYAGTLLARLDIAQTYTGAIGDASSYLQADATVVRIGAPSNSGTEGVGSGRIKLNLGTNASTITIDNTSSTTSDSGLEPVRILAVNAANVLYMNRGRAGIATTVPGEVSTFATVSQTGGTINVGSGTTLTTYNQSGGTGYLNCAATTVRQTAGTLTTVGSGAITNLYVGGTVVSNSTGTITLAEVADGATLDLSQNPAARTITTLKIYGRNAKIKMNKAARGHITITNPVQFVNCEPAGQLDVGANMTFAVGTI